MSPPEARRRLLAIVPATLLGGCLFEDKASAARRAFNERRYAEARHLWRALAADGDTEAQCNLARLYQDGLGVRRDDSQAARWYERAARRGNPVAQSELSVLYAYGRGVPVDLPRAWAWATLAAAGYPKWSGDLRDIALRNRDTVARLMTAEQLRAAQALLETLRDAPRS